MIRSQCNLVIFVMVTIMRSCIQLSAQYTNISCRIFCRVLSSETKKNIDNCTLVLVNEHDTIYMTYDQKLQYVSSELVAADYTITAYTPGYDTVSTIISLKDPKDTLIVLEMTSSLTELPRLRVIPEETIHNVFATTSSEFNYRVHPTAGVLLIWQTSDGWT